MGRLIEGLVALAFYTAPVWIPIVLIFMAADWVINFPQPWPWVILWLLAGLLVGLIKAVVSSYRRRVQQHSEAVRWQAELDREVSRVDSMSGVEFEYLVARLLRRSGWQHVDVVGGANDLGADVVAYDQLGTKLVVQCKRYDTGHAVGSPEVQKVAGTHFTAHEADISLMVTSSRFTEPAQRYAAQSGIALIDRGALARWLSTNVPPPRLAPAGAAPTVPLEPPRAKLPGERAGAAARPATVDDEILFDYLSIAIDRADVERGDLTTTIRELQRVTATARLARRFCGRVNIAFAGYDDDVREIFEIPEIRAFVVRLDNKCEYLSFLIDRHTSVARTLLYCVVGADHVEPGKVRVDRAAYEAVAGRWMRQAAAIAQRTCANPKEYAAITAELERTLQPRAVG